MHWSSACALTLDGVVSLLLVDADLGEPGAGREQEALGALAELLLAEHLALLLCAPVHVAL